MKSVEIMCANDYAYIECPHCKHWEEHHVDEQRHHIQTFDLVWPDHSDDGKYEVSNMTCHVCGGEFELVWNYDNK